MIPNVRQLVRALLSGTAALGLLFAATACDAPKQDKFQSQGGIAANPEGIMRGSVVYLGPRPVCQYRNGKVTRVRGRVILTLFQYDNPPPPEGRASSALNLLAISGERVFAHDDCLPQGDLPDLSDAITRSVSFEWPMIPLGKDAVEYQVRGFYDYDEDMNPFFSVTRLPTAGDVVGAALNDVTSPSKGLLRVGFPPLKDAPEGFVRAGVTVTLGNYVWTELPAFQLNPKHRALSAEAIITLHVDMDGVRVPATVRGIWHLTCGTANPPSTCGLSLQSLKQSVAGDALSDARVDLSFDPKRYAFFVKPVDLKTVVLGGPDVPKPDGIPDPHPLLGASLGVTWSTPIVLFTRAAQSKAQAGIEAAAGIPSVTMIGTVLPDQVATKQTFVGHIDVAVPPLTVVDLNPKNSQCRIPYAAPGNLTPIFEDRVANCSDLPTGLFGINVLHGVSSGVRVKETDPAVSENGVRIEGGAPSGQAWSVPNELADPVQVGPKDVLALQGMDGAFIVHDPEPTKTGNCKVARDPRLPFVERKLVYRGICKAGESPLIENRQGVDNLACLPSTCCDSVRHLCDVPLCPTQKVNGLNVRTSPSKIVKTEGALNIPDCIPFPTPALCCEP